MESGRTKVVGLIQNRSHTHTICKKVIPNFNSISIFNSPRQTLFFWTKQPLRTKKGSRATILRKSSSCSQNITALHIVTVITTLAYKQL